MCKNEWKNNLKDFLICLFVLQEVKMKFFKQESGGGKEEVKFTISEFQLEKCLHIE